MPHSTTKKKTIWTSNQCGISSNWTLHYQKVLQISLWIQKQVWCKQSLICQSSVEAMGMAVWAVKLKTHKKTVCQKKTFWGKTTVIIKVHPWMCTPPPTLPSHHPFPFPPHADPSSRADERNPKGRHRRTSAIWSKLLPKGPTEEQSINPVAVLSWEKKKKLKQFYTDKNMVATNHVFQLGIEVSLSW